MEKNKTIDERLEEIKDIDELDEQAYLDAFNEVNSQTPSAETDSDEAGESDSDDGSPDEKIPEPDGGKKPSAKGTASDGDEEEADDPYAWIDNLPEEDRARAKALQHAAVSDAGRVASLRKRVSDYEARLTAKQASNATGRANAPSSTAKPEDKQLSPKLKEFVEAYPQLAESVQEMVRSDRAELESLIDQRLQPFQEEATYREITEARNRLEEGAAEIFDTPTSGIHYSDVLQSDLYKEVFLESQPAEFQQMARTTSDPDTALWVLKQFMTFAEQYAIENDLMDEEDMKSSSVAEKTREARSKKKATAGTPTPRSAVTDPDESLDYEAIFKRINS